MDNVRMGKNGFYVVSLKSPAHMRLAYVGFASLDSAPTSKPAWFITNDPAQAFNFGDFFAALEFKTLLEGGNAHGLRNDGHIWRISQNVQLQQGRERPPTP